MANKVTYTLEINTELNSLLNGLKKAKESMAKLGDSNFVEGFETKIDSIVSAIDKLQKKASQPIDSKSTFNSLEKSFSPIITDAGALLKELEKIVGFSDKEKISLLPEKEANRLKEIIAIVAQYEKAVEKLENKRIRTVESAKLEQSETKERKKAAEKQVATYEANYEEASKKYGGAAAILQQAEASKRAKKEIVELRKSLTDYKDELEELTKIQNKNFEQEERIGVLRKDIQSISGKIGARTRIANQEPAKEDVEKAQKELGDEAPQILELQKQAEAARAEVEKLAESIKKLDAKIEENSTEITSSQSDYKIFYEQAKKIGISLKGIGENASPENVAQLTQRLKEMVENGLAPVKEATQEAIPHIRDVGNVAKDTGEKVASSSESFASMVDNAKRLDSVKSTIAQFVGWTGASKALSAALRNAFSDIKELDKAMTEIAVVTDFSVGDMWSQMPQYTQRANELGIAITEAYEASALFYQQGLSTNEMIELSNETLKMARIAGLEASEATDRMTAALRGFNMELDKASAQKVADVYSELAAITASDVDEISSAMTKTASIASSAGMEFETTAAFLSQIIETTRESAETAGTAMKTVIARFQELKKDPSEIGEIEGEIVDANKIETALRSVGVSLRDAGGQFRELDEVFMELSSKWDSLDKNTQRYIATIAAGSRQQSRFIAMMQDYERTQQLVAAANISAGASQRQYEKTLESLETKLAKLDNAWTEFSTGLMNSELVKAAVDFLTNILTALNKVTKGFDGFTGSLAKIGTLVAIFQTAKVVVSKFFDEIIQNIYTSAYRAGERIAQGTQDGINSKTVDNTKSLGTGRLVGYSQAKQGLGKIKKSKNISIDDDKAAAWQKNYNDLIREKNNLINEGKKDTEDYKNTIEHIKVAEEQRIYTSKEALEMEQQGFKDLANGAAAAGQAITMVGVGIGVVAQMFANAGMEETAEVFSTIGTAVTLLGTALMALVPIITLLGTTVTTASGQMTVAGWLVQGAWWPLLLIFIALVAIIGVVAIAANAIKKASPEYKLEKAQEAADKAAEAADRAAESYENLKNAFEGLDEGYKALENLTRGTEEWNEAVKNINDSVLDLIQQYPELAKFVDNEAGVLTIDLDDENVQQVLKNAEASAVIANNSSTMAALQMARAEDDVAYKNLDDDAKLKTGEENWAYAGSMAGAIGAGAAAGAGIGALVGTVVPVIGNAVGAAVGAGIGAIGGLIGGFFTGEAARDATLEDTQKKTEALAKAIADGAIIDNGYGYEVKDKEKLAKYGLEENSLAAYYNQIGDATEDLREFGNALLETDRQAEAAFGALAASAYSLADTLGMTDEEKQQASNIVDDATVQKMYKDELNKLGDTDFTDESKMSDEEKKKRDEAIKAQYGANARIEGNKVFYTGADGKTQETAELTSDEIKAITANYLATNQAKTAVEMAPAVIDELVKNTGLSAIESAVLDQEGGNLTKEQKDSLLGEEVTQKLKDQWDKLDKEYKDIFGTEEDYLKKIQGAANIADKAFEKAEEGARGMGFELQSFMTSDMAKGFTTKMQDVYAKSGQEGIDAIMEQYRTLLEGRTEAEKSEITALINGTDWTNTERLLYLQQELELRYGYSADAARDFTQAIEIAAFATSSLTTTVEVFGELWRATERINQSVERMTQLQWEYDRALKNGGDVSGLTKKMLDEYQLQADNYTAAYEASNTDIAKIYAQGVLNYGADLTKAVKLGSYGIEVDENELQNFINTGRISQEDADKWLKQLQDQYKTSQSQLDGLRKTLDSIEELEQQGEDAYYELRDIVKDAMLADMQKQIDLQQALLDATEDTNSRLIEKIQEQIDDTRQARENAKTEQDIANKETQLAYLMRDTSGGNATEIAQLQKEIAESKEGYTDSLIDQSIQDAQDANEKAAEQRQHQIDIAQLQLEAYQKSAQFQKDIDENVNSILTAQANGTNWLDTEIGGLISNQVREGLSDSEYLNKIGTISGLIDKAEAWKTTDYTTMITGLQSDIDSIMGSLSTLPTDLMDISKDMTRKDQIKQLEGAGFDKDWLEKQSDEDLDKLSSFTKNEDSSAITTAQTTLNRAGVQDWLTQKEFYEQNKDKILSGEHEQTYTDYITGQVSLAKEKNAPLEEKAAKALSGHWLGWGGRNSNLEYLALRTEYAKANSGSSKGFEEKVAKFYNELKGKESASQIGTFNVNGIYYNQVGLGDGTVYHKGYLNKDGGLWYSFDSYPLQEQGQASLGSILTGLFGEIDQKIVMYEGVPYIYNTGKEGGRQGWHRLNDLTRDDYFNNFKNYTAFKTGGLADFTGPAWLDGTKSKPEIVLNQQDSANFLVLRDILSDILNGTSDLSKTDKKDDGGDNYYDIEINVESLGDDYDVEQLAGKVRDMIYDDATYRNVNAINK